MIAVLAKMLGLSSEHAEASMHSERAARAVLTRRNTFAAGAALAMGAAFSFGSDPAGFWVQNPKLLAWEDIELTIDGRTWKLGGMPMRVIEIVGNKVTRKLAGPAGCDITVTGDESGELRNNEIEILQESKLPSFRGRARL